MELFERETRVAASSEEAYAWHARPGAFERLTPPWERVRVLDGHPGLEEGAKVVLSVRAGPFRRKWVALHRDVRPGEGFVDEQEAGPFPHWVHTHSFEDDPCGGSRLGDRIEYTLPFGFLGRALGKGAVRRKLVRMFAFRHAVTASDLDRHVSAGSAGPMRLAVTGATGLVGTALTHFMTAGGHEVRRVVRRQPRPDSNDVFWDPAGRAVDTAGLEGLDAVVHLAGEGIASSRWSTFVKARIRDSRVEGTRVLCEALAGLERKPRTLVCASAIGFYGDRGDEPVDESSPPGKGFLPEVCRQWEQASEAAAAAGIRVVHVRVGVVLSLAGGALRQMSTPFRFGLGGRLGSGEQVMSWISLHDLVGVIHHALTKPDLTGAVNATAPEPETNAEFTRILGRVLRRPAVLPVPRRVLTLAVGEMADALLLSGAHVLPRRLEESGFRFRHPRLEDALRFELGR